VSDYRLEVARAKVYLALLFAAEAGLTRAGVLGVLEGVMPSESDTPAPSLPGPRLAATAAATPWEAWKQWRSG
jgi:hypothetical protein